MTVPGHQDHREAKEALAFIRQTMESASTYTAVSGWGLVAVGGIGLLASWMAASVGVAADLRVWVPAALLSVSVAMGANAWKARRSGESAWTGAFRKIAWVITPVLAAGAVLTVALARAGAEPLLPGTWLALYGAGITAGGIFSVRAIRALGIVLLGLGATALLAPGAGLALLAVGFGGLHLAVGLDLAWRHGG